MTVATELTQSKVAPAIMTKSMGICGRAPMVMSSSISGTIEKTRATKNSQNTARCMEPLSNQARKRCIRCCSRVERIIEELALVALRKIHLKPEEPLPVVIEENAPREGPTRSSAAAGSDRAKFAGGSRANGHPARPSRRWQAHPQRYIPGKPHDQSTVQPGFRPVRAYNGAVHAGFWADLSARR
jgi:hypothetical protein